MDWLFNLGVYGGMALIVLGVLWLIIFGLPKLGGPGQGGGSNEYAGHDWPLWPHGKKMHQKPDEKNPRQ
jgi:hypothetical protein